MRGGIPARLTAATLTVFALCVSGCTTNATGPSISFLAPAAEQPANGAIYNFTQQPVMLTIASAVRTRSGTVTYRVEVATTSNFPSLVFERSDIPEGAGGVTNVQLPQFAGDATYHWRAFATVDGVRGHASTPRSFSIRPNIVIQPPVNGGQIDLGSVTVVRGLQSVGTWPATSTVTNATAQTGGLCIFHTKLGVWPGTVFFDDPNTLAEGNQWIFANINGRWYGGAGHWYRPGQACKEVDASSIAGGGRSIKIRASRSAHGCPASAKRLR